mmetsp:Transcript_21655/g.38685  ORF Transcript_21655/g.38685 Transcript_21655/m.38685 type:complete len:270 (-) Transcript_21655:520-1329(-)|eukprot:CAMPEP_0175068238 /NCGR_PEP_ID=MMETSP0052_2-20121109/17565_1 /TAXON_ID=51329 ORGANISM="Polytomella parva, Strain SAG 63-3" /NCGR_SAMPLE_ID=MMETSP0052_2 /ASSEMBLY_ACC=CAM_ASM_000194 /LENGTH=269 /DNA_ID=CAMNT_0016335253 /DNA_START=130 /DNA_END=939 /DNA_ORIENTATION=+
MSRPTGTDGSDYNFREVIDAKYKRMAENLKRAMVVMPIQSVAVVLKTNWLLIPVYCGMGEPRLQIFLLSIPMLISSICFYAAKPRSRGNLPLLKISSLASILCICLHVLDCLRYYGLSFETNDYTQILDDYLYNRLRYDQRFWTPALATCGYMLDLFCVVSLLAGSSSLHLWVKDRMAADKSLEIRRRQLATDAVSSSSSSSSTAPATSPSSAAASRRSAPSSSPATSSAAGSGSKGKGSSNSVSNNANDDSDEEVVTVTRARSARRRA